MLTFLSLMFGTLVSEDLACVTAGLLIQRGQIEASSAVVACTLGIFAGDVGLCMQACQQKLPIRLISA